MAGRNPAKDYHGGRDGGRNNEYQYDNQGGGRDFTGRGNIGGRDGRNAGDIDDYGEGRDNRNRDDGRNAQRSDDWSRDGGRDNRNRDDRRGAQRSDDWNRDTGRDDRNRDDGRNAQRSDDLSRDGGRDNRNRDDGRDDRNWDARDDHGRDDRNWDARDNGRNNRNRDAGRDDRNRDDGRDDRNWDARDDGRNNRNRDAARDPRGDDRDNRDFDDRRAEWRDPSRKSQSLHGQFDELNLRAKEGVATMLEGFAKSPEWTRALDSKVEDIMSQRNPGPKFITLKNLENYQLEEKDVVWPAFPDALDERNEDHLKLAERAKDMDIGDGRSQTTYPYQDEYCEWTVARRNDRKITKVVFTTEMREFWNFLRRENPSFVQDYEDAAGGAFIHMRNGPNSLHAAVDLAAAIASLPSDISEIQDGEPLLAKKGFGAQSRARLSDRMIASTVYDLCKDGYQIAVKNPLGMYIQDFDVSNLECPTASGCRIEECWRWEREVDGSRMRLVVEVPKKYGFTVSDIKDTRTNKRINYGSQLARYVSVALTLFYIKRGEAPLRRVEGSDKTPFQLWGWVEGRDKDGEAKPLDQNLRSQCSKDWFGRLLQRVGPANIKTTRALLQLLPERTWVPFVVHDGLGVPFVDVENAPQPRALIVCTPEFPPSGPANRKIGKIEDIGRNAFEGPTILIVCHYDFDSEKLFLQLASYSPALGMFNFYERKNRGSPGWQWYYHGCSTDAFEETTMRKGPACGHVNGSLVMKELRKPWLHWISSRQTSLTQSVKPNHPILQEKLLGDRLSWVQLADRLEPIITKGVRKWYETRRKLDFDSTHARQLDRWVAHALLTTTVNIGASPNASTAKVLQSGSPFAVPHGFFYNYEAFEELFGEDFKPQHIIEVKADLYKEAVANLDVKFFTGESIESTERNEGQAPWTVLLPSYEDRKGLQVILAENLLTIEELTALLLVDFYNPIYSWRRAALMTYVPSTANKTKGVWDLGSKIRSRIGKPAADSPEEEYLDNLDDIQKINASPTDAALQYAHKRIDSYIARINSRIRTVSGVEDFLKLAESQRRTFQPPKNMGKRNPLAETRVGMPCAKNLRNARPQCMTFDGMVRENLVPRGRERNLRDIGFLQPYMISGCPFSS